jgi:hypothetical protein
MPSFYAGREGHEAITSITFTDGLEQTACHVHNLIFYNNLYIDQNPEAGLMWAEQRCEGGTQRRMQRGISPSYGCLPRIDPVAVMRYMWGYRRLPKPLFSPP